MSNFNWNIKKWAQEMLLIEWRKPRFVAWIRSLLAGVALLVLDFVGFRDKARFEVGLNGTVLFMEWWLNQLFDPIQRRIYIDDVATSLERVELWLEVEQQPSPTLWLESEIPPGEGLELYTYEEYANDADFIVYVPNGLSYDATLFNAWINKMRFKSRQYEIETY